VTDTITERAWQAKVVELARWLGWAAYHTHDSRRSEPGFPDLVLVRGDRLLFVELKSARGRITPAQQAWLDRLAPCAEVHVWRPDDWPSVQRCLVNRTKVPG